MAAAEESLDCFEDEFICSLCRGYFEEPVIIHCGHNFCRACITRRWARCRDTFPCPHCGAESPEIRLRPNRQLRNAADLFTEERGSRADDTVCETHGRRLNLFCKEDRTPICAMCRVSRAHRSHPVVPIEEESPGFEEHLWAPTGIKAALQGRVLHRPTGRDSPCFRQDIISWQLPMALSTCSGRDEGYKLVVRDRFEAGMRELVCFTQHLLEAKADPHAHGKIRERIQAASRDMSAAEEELGRQLEMVDATTQELVVKKKSLQDEQEEKKENLKRLRIQLDSCRRSEREARETLERANRQLGETQAELQRRRAEAASNRLTRDIGIGLMFIPIVGTIAGSIMVGCGQVYMNAAQKAAGKALDAINQHTNDASKYSAEVCRYEEQERQVEAEIAANEQRLAQIDAEQQTLAASHEEIVDVQNGLRNCVISMNRLVRKVRMAKRLTKHLLIYEELANILGEIVQQVLPLMSPGGEAGMRFLAAGELQGLIEKLESGGCSLRALADTEAAAIEF